MTNQEIFDTVYLGLASQGFQRSVDREGELTSKCLYRGANGRKCAAGWLIPDDEYYPEMDEQGIVTRVDYFRNKYDASTLLFIKHLQESHDMGETPAKMRSSLIFRAKEYGITVPEIPNA